MLFQIVDISVYPSDKISLRLPSPLFLSFCFKTKKNFSNFYTDFCNFIEMQTQGLVYLYFRSYATERKLKLSKNKTHAKLFYGTKSSLEYSSYR